MDEFSGFLERCGCGSDAPQRYRDQNGSSCEAAFGNLAGAVAAGDFIYDAAAADALFARLHAPDAPCVEEPFRALALDSSELYSFAGVFTGTHALGSPCTSPVGYKGGLNDCREGVCAPDPAGGGVCIALVGVGEECDASGDENLNSTTTRLCFEQRPPDSDGEYESSFDSLSCLPAAAGGTARICMRDLEDGELCSNDAICASGRCASDGVQEPVCAAKLADSQPCASSGDCVSGACRYDVEPPVCGAPLADAQPCSYDNGSCASGNCFATSTDVISGGVCRPAPTRAPGESCSQSYECISAGHGDSRDGTCQDGVCYADICVDYLQ